METGCLDCISDRSRVRQRQCQCRGRVLVDLLDGLLESFSCSSRSYCGPHPTSWLVSVDALTEDLYQANPSQQTIFADNSFSKPYFVTYLNTSFFSLFLVSSLARQLWLNHGSITKVMRGRGNHVRYGSVGRHEHEVFLKPDLEFAVEGGSLSSSGSLPNEESIINSRTFVRGGHSRNEAGLNVRDTAKLSLEFCILWVCLS